MSAEFPDQTSPQPSRLAALELQPTTPPNAQATQLSTPSDCSPQARHLALLELDAFDDLQHGQSSGAAPPPFACQTPSSGDDMPADAPNLGSVAHANGTCRPCGFFWSSDGCRKGRACGHCHLCDEDQIHHRRREYKQRAREAKAASLAAMAADSHAAPHYAAAATVGRQPAADMQRGLSIAFRKGGHGKPGSPSQKGDKGPSRGSRGKKKGPHSHG